MKAENSSLIPHPSSFSLISRSAAQTRALGRRLGKLLRGGEVIGLSGELGSGKTCFVRGMAEGLDVSPQAWIRSPSFTLINEYDGRLPIYHIDLYRVASPRELEELNLREYLFSDGVSVIEWFERLPAQEVDGYLLVEFAHADGNGRRITLGAHGERYGELIKGMKKWR